LADLSHRLMTALADRYRIERELGRGGMATVFLAKDLKHPRQVAIKVLDPEVAAAIGPERFLREIETVARLTHPHILPLHDSGTADSLLFYVMPYIEGESLRSRLAREKQLPLADAQRIAAELADALDYAHEHGVVHRDLKPENVLLQHGRALLADFGIARAVAAAAQKLTSTGVAVGTPSYMSPEQVAAGTVDARSDVYGLGCVVFEMLAGQPPFTGPTAESLAHQHMNVPAPEVTQLRPSAGAGVAAALMRALAKTPADRFATTGEFAGALAATVEPGPRPGVRSARWTVVAAAGFVLAFAAVATWQQWRPFGARTAPAPTKKDWILVAEFEGPRDEPDLARAAQGLTAVALDQSGIVMTVPRDQLSQALEQAGKPDTLRVDGPLARELAYRNSIRAVLEGRVSRVGTGYGVVLRLSDSGSDSTLISVSGSARDGDALIPALDRLARRLRRELSENPAAVRATEALWVIMTPSFAAYRKIEETGNYWSATADAAGGLRLMRDALALDPDCAVAYLESAVFFSTLGDRDSAVWACDQALSRPQRLTDEQRLYAEARRSFYRADFEGALQTLNRQLLLFPAGQCADGAHTLRSLVSFYGRRFPEAVEDARRASESSAFGPTQMHLWNQFIFERQAGQLDEAEKTLGRLQGMWRQVAAVEIAVGRNNWARAESLCANPPRDLAANPFVLTWAAQVRIALLARRGELHATREEMAREALHGDPGGGRRIVRRLLAQAMITGTPIPGPDSVTARDTTTWGVVTRGWRAALVRDLPAARRELSGLRRRSPDELRRAGAAADFLEASIAAAEDRWSDVIRLIGPVARRGDDLGYLSLERIGPTLERWLVAEAYDRTGPPDSAAAAFERVLEPPESRGIIYFPVYAHQRLVMIYARMGRREDAERHWREFSATFTNPDPEVRHLLDEARTAIMGLRAVSQRKG
jgi:tetratricopeptide (TPR) repeat protein